MLIDGALVVAGLVLLAVAADAFVVGAARLAVVLRVTPVVIGAVVIGVGTSLPEVVVSGLAAAQGKLDLAVGNIIGSTVANLTLVLGVAAVIAPVRADARTLRRELPLTVGAVVVFAVAVQGGLTRAEGVVLLACLVGAVVLVLAGARGGAGDQGLARQIAEHLDVGLDPGDGPSAGIDPGAAGVVEPGAVDPSAGIGADPAVGPVEPDHDDHHDRAAGHPGGLPIEVGSIGVRGALARIALGLVGTLAGAQALVWGAAGIAADLGVGEGFVGLTVVAIGTALPELVTAVAAARRGEHGLIVGNLLGSSLLNSLGVAGIVAVVGPGTLADGMLAGRATVLLLVATAAAGLAMVTGRAVARREGIALLAAYAIAIPLLA